MKFAATRLAPSPTGALHLGHARTFLMTWWMARQAGARIYMRMDDIDAGRAKAEAVAQAYEDLRWLGMDWDGWKSGQGSVASGQKGEDGAVVQSLRQGLYDAAVERLWELEAIYPCVCTRADIAAAVAGSASAPHEGEGQVRYPGTCRERFARSGSVRETLAAIFAETGKWACLRLRVAEKVVSFEDVMAGWQAVNVGVAAGDFPVTRFAVRGEHRRDADATVMLPPAYQLACVVDDHAMGIDMVIRGDDLLASTPRQMLLYEALGYGVPRFAHVPLVIGADGKRLAKRHGESRIAQFRGGAGGAGVRAERVVGWAAWRSGQLEEPREISALEMVGRFDVGKVPRERVVLEGRDLEVLR